MRYVYTFIIFTMLIAAACKTAKPTATNSNISTPNTNVTVAGNGDSYILAVILKASRKEGDSAVVFEISSVKKKQGKLKEGQNDNSGNDYSVSFANDKNKVIKAYHIKHPLDTWIESSDKSGKLQTTPFKKNEDFISVRTNYTPDMKNLIIQKTNSNEKTIIPLSIN